MDHGKQIPAKEQIFDIEDGRVFIKSSREAIKCYLEKHVVVVSKALQDPRYELKLGCFVTLKLDDPEKSLRGCIGFPEPSQSLTNNLTQASVYSATEDPRFSPVSRDELSRILIEVSILNKPKLIEARNPRELPSHIEIGKDGLIMRWAFGAGLLLPQVAIEQNWTPEEFLTNLSMKAGAMPDQWLVPETQILKFQCQVFSELQPKGNVQIELQER